jgi:Flp pilus assembly protein TadD
VWQRGLSISHEKLGDLALALGDTAAAREAHQQAHAITERLAAADPGNSQWQRDLSASHSRLGNLALALGDTAAAREHYRQALAIGERLAAADPGNSQWQRDLSVSHNKLGDLALTLGDTAAAREAYRQALAIRERLAVADPGNGEWQRDLFASYLRISRVRLAADETAEALEATDKGLAIARRLAGADPSNPRRAAETAAALGLRGQVHDAQGHLDLATDDYREAAKLNPDDADAQGALGWSLIRLGRFAEARAPTEQAHRLAPTDVNWTINLGHTYLLAGDPVGAQPYYDASIAQIPDAAALTQGPVADFELFIAKGWQVKACRAALARMREGFARRASAKPAGGAAP